MTDDSASNDNAPPRELSPAARRALAEAEARRAEAERQAAEQAKEVGRKGPDPARYGDWEKNGIVSDF
jgi:hypothetical protein